MTRPAAGHRRLAAAAAVAAVTITLTSVAASLVLIGLTLRDDGSATFDVFTLGGLSLGGTYAIVGWLVASRRQDNVIGWVFLGIGLSQSLAGLATLASIYGLIVRPGSLPLAAEWSWLATWIWAPGFTLLVTFSLLLFPDGHLPSARWRPIAWLSVVTMALLVIPPAIAAWPSRGIALTGSRDALSNTLGLAEQIQFFGLLVSSAVAIASIASIVTRFRRSSGRERQQLKWFTYAAIPEISFVFASAFVTMPPFVGVVMAPLLPVAIGIAILRYHLYEIDRLISRTIAYAVVTGVLVATFGVMILLLQAVLAPFTQGQTIAVAASTLAVFALSQPIM